MVLDTFPKQNSHPESEGKKKIRFLMDTAQKVLGGELDFSETLFEDLRAARAENQSTSEEGHQTFLEVHEMLKALPVAELNNLISKAEKFHTEGDIANTRSCYSQAVESFAKWKRKGMLGYANVEDFESRLKKLGLVCTPNTNSESVSVDPETSPRDVFFQTVKKRVQKLQDDGWLPKGYANGLLERAGYIDGPFDDINDAQQSGVRFLESSAEPVAQLMRQLNSAEITLLKLSGDIALALENLDRAVVSPKKKAEVSSGILSIDTEINNFVSRIQKLRDDLS